MEQRTSDWHAARCGKLTASRMADALAKTKSGWGASRENLIATLVTERLTNNQADSFSNADMQWGNDQEPFARVAYEALTGNLVDEVGFVDHPHIAMSGASPDGLVDDDGLVEIKCPKTSTHLATLLGGSIPGKYEKQMQWQMACTGRSWCDFVSFDPRMPARMQIHIVRVYRDNDAIVQMEKDAADFLQEVAQRVIDLNVQYPENPDEQAPPAPPAAGASSPPSTAGAAECQPGTRDEEPAAYDDGQRIKLKDINDAIAPLAITQAGLAELGIESVGREKNAVLYRASDFRVICSRLIGRLHSATLTTHKVAA